MKRISILVTHLLGGGHLSRSLYLARALRDAGMSPQLISGGMSMGHLDLTGIDFIQLPPVRSDSVSFTRLLDSNGSPATSELLEERTRTIETTIGSYRPDILITELFPFGRRVLRDEFLTGLSAAKANTRARIFASIRDILAPPSNEKKASQTENWLAEHYEGVLVHSDPCVITLEKSWPVSSAIAPMLHYTGFVAPAPSAENPATGGEGADEIIVTAGGGPVGRRLFDVSVDAARLGTRRWRLLVGGPDAAAICAQLHEKTKDVPVVAEPLRKDYRTLLMRCAAAVGQCGYNTAMDWLQAGVPGVFVPFAEGGEIEQTLRAASLEKRYGYGRLAEEELTPDNLAAATQAAVVRGRFTADDVDFHGAERTGRILREFLEVRK